MFFNEKQSIRDSSKSLKKYGSTHTCNHVRNSEILIRHEIGKLDTLQGIALKYGCTTEQIRRTNRLFASDSLFMRQYLLIPVGKSSPYYPKDERPHSLPARAYSVATGSNFNTTLSLGMMSTSPQQQQFNTNQNNINFNSNSSTNTSTSSKSMESVVMSPEEENKKSIDEFLGKIDSTIAESKKYVAKSQNNSTDMLSGQLDEAFLSYSGYDDITNNKNNRYYQHSSSSTSQQHTRHSSSGSTSDTAHLLNLNQGKRVQNSLQRLEKQQDEFFEL